MRNFLVGLAVLACAITFIGLLFVPSNEGSSLLGKSSKIERMPIVEDEGKFAKLKHGGEPVAQRGKEFRKWLSAGVKIKIEKRSMIRTDVFSGSGTIVFYNNKTNWAYVQSCGHLWDGNMSASEGKKRQVRCKIITWYHNDTKLDKPEEYIAEVLYYNNSTGADVSLLRFKPKWKPKYFPIATKGYELKINQRLHSIGCDKGNEVAHYDVRFIGVRSKENDYVTTENSPRPGRSGGGLLTDMYYIGVCWGTSSRNGEGNGYFTKLSAVRKYNKMNGFGWLNEITPYWARMLPIIDHNNPQGEYNEDYIPLPNN